jgi:predicted nuclease of predicted toxin-antitoxin system
MKGFVLDENLPVRFPSTAGLTVLHVRDLGSSLSDSEDSEVWAYAKAQDLVIVTKDADFADRMMMSDPPPRVVHIRIGNKRLADFTAFVSRIWPKVVALIQSHKLVSVYSTRYEAVA